jgi:hypothetical protein
MLATRVSPAVYVRRERGFEQRLPPPARCVERPRSILDPREPSEMPWSLISAIWSFGRPGESSPAPA